MIEVRIASVETVNLLRNVGCVVESWRLPDELFSHWEFVGERVSENDVIDFHFALRAATDEQILAAAGRG
jgi:hypothetical protein